MNAHNKMKTPKALLKTLKKCIPGSTRKFRKRLIAHAHLISQDRTGSSEYNHLVVTSVIRGSIKNIRAGKNVHHVHHLFTAEPHTATCYPILPLPDPMCVLLPNEMWAGKGSAGKNNLTK